MRISRRGIGAEKLRRPGGIRIRATASRSASVEIHERTTNRPLFCCRELNFSMDSQRLIDHQQAIVQAVPTSVLADVCPRVSVERVIYSAVSGGCFAAALGVWLRCCCDRLWSLLRHDESSCHNRQHVV